MISEFPVVKSSAKGKILARRILSLYQQFIRAATFFMAPRAAISQHYSKSIFRNAKAIYKDSLRSLPYADEPLRKDLRDSLRHYAVHYASILTPLHRVTRLGGYLWVPAFGVALFISDNVEYNESRLVGAILPTIAFGISVGLSIFLTRTIRRTAVALIGLISISAIIFFSIILLYDPSLQRPFSAGPHTTDGQILNMVIGGALTCTGALLAMGLTMGMIHISLVSAVFRKIDRRPEIMIASFLLTILYDLEGSGRNLADVTFKKHVCAGLEVASAFLEKSLPRAMGLINIDTREQFNERCRSGAIELRDMQVRLSLMDGKTVDTLKHDIVRYIGIVTQGKYGLLPTGAPAIRDESKKSVFVRIIKGVFIAFIPIGCLLGAKYAGLGLAGAVANWALIAGLGWAALTLISTLDPKYRTRLNDIRSIVSMIRGQGNQ